MVYRVYVEKKPEFATEAASLAHDVRELLGISGLTRVRLFNRYDAQGLDADVFAHAVSTVFSEPQVDFATFELDVDDAIVFATEYLPGQFDQRADSAAQCIQLITQAEKPLIRSAFVYALYGNLSDADVAAIKHYVINPVEAREATLELPTTLDTDYVIPTEVATLDGFCALDAAGLADLIKSLGLAMDLDDIAFCQKYFDGEHRDPTITEIRMIDTYWSDHCRHTTFNTVIDSVKFEDPLLEQAYQHYLDTRAELGRTKPICLMDIATLAVRSLKAQGKLDKLDESEEINACTVKVDVDVDGVKQPWLLLFKNETHNHPTEIEPFGGAATCVGGAIRDPLSGRSYVYAAMRLTGAADPLTPLSDTIPGKLAQRTIVTAAAKGYSSYGNQIGLATGIVDELYHPGYAAKRMEIGAVIAAAPAENVRREVPQAGDVVILLGGSTGRDGIGGATGSSKAHDSHSVETCGAEVQKGNAPEERKLQRLFRNQTATRLIKRCNDFGAGGVSVAIGELAPGLEINLNAVPKKYEGLDGTELAISESQERMAVVVEAKDVDAFLALAADENLQACPVARVSAEPRLTMEWNGQKIVDISREFLDSNGAEKHIDIEPEPASDFYFPRMSFYEHETAQSCDSAYDPATEIFGDEEATFAPRYKKLVGDLNICSRRGLSERFDSTIGAASVLMPFGGKNQKTPIQAMVHKLPVLGARTDTCSLMSWGYNPFISDISPYHGAYLAVVESVSKLVATGAEFKDVYLTFQEYFEKLGRNPQRWGKPFSALLGAFEAQMALGIGAIGGKDSMSGSFEDLDVPPTLVSFAVTTQKTQDIVSPEFKQAGRSVALFAPEYDDNELPIPESLLATFETVTALVRAGVAKSVYTPGMGGVAEAIYKMSIGNGFGFDFDSVLELDELFDYSYGSFIVEMDMDVDLDEALAAIKNVNLDEALAAIKNADSECCPFASDLKNCDGGAAISLTPDELSERLWDGLVLGQITDKPAFTWRTQSVDASELESLFESKLESVFVCNDVDQVADVKTNSVACDSWATARIGVIQPKFLIPAFPGTNCEFDSARAVERAGGKAEIFVVKNLTPEAIAQSVEDFARKIDSAQAIFIPGGFSGGDEPDGSGKFITSFFRNGAIKDSVAALLNEREGLMAGICNGFQALIKLGLVPYGRIVDPTEDSPTLTFNTIGRHQSKLVRTRVASNKSPWLSYTQVGDVYTVPISHGEGRFIASDTEIASLFENGQVATQYVDFDGRPSGDINFNPNGSMCAIEGITSPDGRVFGKMGHSERIDAGLYLNVPGEYDIKMFKSAVKYFQGPEV